MTSTSASAAGVCVLGMHRSGTSAVARLLSLAGLDIGEPSDHPNPASDNVTGYWELLAFREINEELLRRAGGSWLDPPPRDEGWSGGDDFAPLRAAARRIAGEKLGHARDWVWKDPRTCLTLPFWRSVFPDMRFVVCVRNPLSVVASLVERNDLDPLLARDLWSEYTDGAIWGTDGARRTFVHFEDLVADPLGELRRVLGAVPLSDGSQPLPGSQARAFVQSQLQHHRHTLEDVTASDTLDAGTKAVYEELHATHFATTHLETAEFYRRVAARLSASSQDDPDLIAAARGVERQLGCQEQSSPSTAARVARELRLRHRRDAARLHEWIDRLEQDSAERARQLESLVEKQSWIEVRLAAGVRQVLTPLRQFMKSASRSLRRRAE